MLVLVALGAVYVWWAFNIPYAPRGGYSAFPLLNAPDENMRMEVLEWILEHGALPRGDEPELLDELWGFSYALSVYGSTLLAIPGASIAAALGAGVEGIVLAARLTDVALSVAALALFFRVADRLFALAPTRFLFVGLIGFLPQFAFVSSYFNCEALDLFSVALTTLFLMRGIEGHWKLGDCCALGIALGVCALSYYFAYGLFPVSILVYYVSVVRIRAREGDLVVSRDLIFRPLLVALCAFAVCGWFFVRNLVLHGDFFGTRTINELGEAHAIEELKPSNRVTPQSLGVSIPSMVIDGGDGQFLPWGPYVFKSSVGAFGMMSVFLGTLGYAAYALILGIGCVFGVVRFCVDMARGRGSQWLPLAAGAVALMIAFTLAMALFYSWSSDYQPQGRHVMAAMPALMLVVAYGYGGGASRGKGDGAPVGRHALVDATTGEAREASSVSAWVAGVVLVLWIALFIWVFATTIVPSVAIPLFP